MSQTAPFQAILDTLCDETAPFPARLLPRFSDLAPADLEAVLRAWPQVSLRRRNSLLEDLGDLAESDTLMSFDDLARALLHDPEAGVRRRAIRLLRESEDPRLAAVYMDFLAREEDEGVRAEAAAALGHYVYLGELEKIPAELKDKVEQSLLEVVRGPAGGEVPHRALEALGYSGRAEVPGLIENAYHRKEPAWKASALNAMGRSSDRRWVKFILAQLRSPRETLRAEAARAAGELGFDSDRPPLLDLLEDEEEPEVRRLIVWALSQIGGEGVRVRLEELFEAQEDDEEAEFLEEALDNLAFTEDLARFDMFEIDPGGEDEEE